MSTPGQVQLVQPLDGYRPAPQVGRADGDEPVWIIATGVQVIVTGVSACCAISDQMSWLGVSMETRSA